MEDLIRFDSELTPQDRLVLGNLTRDVSYRSESELQHKDAAAAAAAADASAARHRAPFSREAPKTSQSATAANGHTGNGSANHANSHELPNVLHENGLHSDLASAGVSADELAVGTEKDVARLRAMNDPSSTAFEPTVFMTWDSLSWMPQPVLDFVMKPYIAWAQGVVRVPTDVVMVTHLILYFTTSVPSAAVLYWHFTYLHGVLHVMMQFYYIGSFTLLMHQHIHQRGVLNKRYALFDRVFPYLTSPLMGQTWNTYYYHHVKHHHVEGNGPNDLSSTIRYQRDSALHFLHYLGRFFFLIWIELPLYFVRTKRYDLAFQIAFWEYSNLILYFVLFTWVHPRATTFVFLLPLVLVRIGLMVGNWGQHAFVDPDEPDSDFRSSITVIDVASNRYCFNDGYHTSHHLNPMRHWREHPVAFLQQKQRYAAEGALVFHDIDYLMITARLLMKDYDRLARCMVPMGDQIKLSLQERIALLKGHTRALTEEEIARKFKKA